MKNLSLITKMLAIMLVLNFSCSPDTTEGENKTETITNTELQLRPSPISPCADDRIGYITVHYDFPPISQVDENGNIIGHPAIKENHYNEMMECFTICSVQETNCPNIDIWAVNLAEYQECMKDKGSGSSNNVVNNGPVSVPPESEEIYCGD